ncbi:MAG: restriction endonuclease subunit S [Deltaproteobacteria bacterium]|nr:restriction endonuclease subunit S [Deltaproteobacteria bacterium]MBK8715682.1 restriction endonuclease subunit S [Deltaproteobacteria bacterium]
MSDVLPVPVQHPDSWATAPLRDVCTLIADGDWIESKDQGASGYRLLQISNVGRGTFVETGNYRWVTEETFHRLNCTEIREGDILIARMPDPIGRAWLVHDLPWRCVTAVDVAIVRADPRVLQPAFLAAALNSPAYLAQAASLATGTTRHRIRRADIARTSIPIPGLATQRAIAHMLGSLDDKIELNRRMSETLEAMARALFKSWFVDFDPVRAKADGRQPSGMDAETAKLFPSEFEQSELGEIPKGWRVAAVGELLSLEYGKALKEEGRRAGGVLVFGSNGQIGSHDVALVSGPGIVVGRKGNPGVVTWAPSDFFVIDTAFYVQRRSDVVGLRYLHRGLERMRLPRLAADSAVPGVNRNAIYAQSIVVPNSRVADAFEGIATAWYSASWAHLIEARLLEDMRDTLLPRLLSGELDVTHVADALGSPA